MYPKDVRNSGSSHRRDSIVENIIPNDAMIHTDIIKVISKIAHYRLVATTDTIQETQLDSGTIHSTILTAHFHQVACAWQIVIHVGIKNIPVIIHPFVTCCMFDLAAYNIRS